jgi:hypothetical protein
MGDHAVSMRVDIVVTRSPGAVAWGIASASAPGHPLWPWGRGLGSVPTHCLIAFHDERGGRYYEAREFSGPEGWRGPLPWTHLTGWLAQDSRRWMRRYDVTDALLVPPDEIARRCRSRLGLWRYSHAQLVRMLVNRRLGIPVRDDASRVVCSEAVVRIMDGVPQQGEHPALTRGWVAHRCPDACSPLDVENGARAVLHRAPVI